MTAPNCKGVLKAADHRSGRSLRQWPPRGNTCHFFSHALTSGTPPGPLILTAAFVAAQALFDAQSGLFGAVIGIGGHAFRFQQGAGIQVEDALRTETEAVAADGRMARVATAEILRRRLLDAIADALLKRHADVDVSPRYAQRHAMPPLSARGACAAPDPRGCTIRRKPVPTCRGAFGDHARPVQRFQRRNVPHVNG